MMRSFLRMGSILLALLAVAAMAWAQSRTLDIYWVDVEGGAATLIVSPTGESLLVDTGFPGQGDRDAQRIARAVKAAGLDHLDYLLITHYHTDHVGGVPALAKLVDIRHFYDHGDNTEPAGAQAYNAYTALAEGKRTILKPGEKFKLGAVSFDVVSAAGSPGRSSATSPRGRARRSESRPASMPRSFRRACRRT